MKEKFYITIGRQLGSNGRTIGKMLAEKLNIAFFDRELINMASEKSGLSREIFENADEKSSHSVLGGLFGMRNSMLDEVYAGSYLCNENLFNIQSEVIRDIAARQAAVFVGRCADYVLKDEKNCVRVFVHADMEERVERISKNYCLPEKESRSFIQKTDKRRAAYYNYYTSREWGQATSYDLCINSSLLGLEGSVDLIHGLVVRKFHL